VLRRALAALEKPRACLRHLPIALLAYAQHAPLSQQPQMFSASPSLPLRALTRLAFLCLSPSARRPRPLPAPSTQPARASSANRATRTHLATQSCCCRRSLSQLIHPVFPQRLACRVCCFFDSHRLRDRRPRGSSHPSDAHALYPPRAQLAHIPPFYHAAVGCPVCILPHPSSPDPRLRHALLRRLAHQHVHLCARRPLPITLLCARMLRCLRHPRRTTSQLVTTLRTPCAVFPIRYSSRAGRPRFVFFFQIPSPCLLRPRSHHPFYSRARTYDLRFTCPHVAVNTSSCATSRTCPS
jgi:hypothetical protein